MLLFFWLNELGKGRANRVCMALWPEQKSVTQNLHKYIPNSAILSKATQTKLPRKPEHVRTLLVVDSCYCCQISIRPMHQKLRFIRPSFIFF